MSVGQQIDRLTITKAVLFITNLFCLNTKNGQKFIDDNNNKIIKQKTLIGHLFVCLCANRFSIMQVAKLQLVTKSIIK